MAGPGSVLLAPLGFRRPIIPYGTVQIHGRRVSHIPLGGNHGLFISPARTVSQSDDDDPGIPIDDLLSGSESKPK